MVAMLIAVLASGSIQRMIPIPSSVGVVIGATMALVSYFAFLGVVIRRLIPETSPVGPPVDLREG